ncbi:MAG TPA: hypothetical protein VFE46_12105 [Pirellulales bacterium]|nr:hypothetical protein [Pirellulales bacterium]
MPILLDAPAVLEQEFLELRARLLQVAAQLDRIDRATGSVNNDPRILAALQAIEVLSRPDPQRAEKVQLIFSRPYDADWKKTLGVAAS